MEPVVHKLFQIGTNSYFDTNIVSLGFLPTTREALRQYDPCNHFDSW